MEYKVTKQHWGDRQYYEGDTREVKVKSDADILVGMGLIADKADAKSQAEQAKKEKAEAAAKAKAEKEAVKPENKMAKEPENKAE